MCVVKMKGASASGTACGSSNSARLLPKSKFTPMNSLSSRRNRSRCSSVRQSLWFSIANFIPCFFITGSARVSDFHEFSRKSSHASMESKVS